MSTKGKAGGSDWAPSWAPTLWLRPEPQARGPGFWPAEALSAGAHGSGLGGRDGAGPEMAPPAGGAADPDPGSAVVLLAVHAAVRPLGAGPDTEAQLRRLQLSADPERPGRFRLELLGAGPGAVSGSRGVARPGGARSPSPGPSACQLRALAQLTFPCFRSLVCKMGIMQVPAFTGLL